MSIEFLVHVGYANGASCHTQNLSSTTWVIYTPTGQVLSSRGVCLQPSSNNIAEYSVVIELQHNVISHSIQSLEVHLDSQLVVLQLNGMYHIRYPTLLRIFL